MTPARIKALQWFHDMGAVKSLWTMDDRPSKRMVSLMLDARQLNWFHKLGHFLTDKGRQELHEATRK